MRRVVSLFLPHWSTDRLRRKTGKPRPDAAIPARPLVTAIPDHGRRIVAATFADARALGIVAGMTLNQARALAPPPDRPHPPPQTKFHTPRPTPLWEGTKRKTQR